MKPRQSSLLFASGIARPGLCASVVIGVACLVRLAPLLACIDSCVVDFDHFHGISTALLHLQKADTRLNAWILAWVQHALLTDPTTIYNANIFHPLPGMLAGSEHLIGVAGLLLPLRLIGANAIALHQSALCLSFALTGASTYMLTRWITGSHVAALLAGVTAVLMPWRLTELSHVQLLGTGFIPLVWLLLARRCIDKDSEHRYAVTLFAATLIQLLSSYYLAYFLVFSLAVLVLVISAQRQVSLKTLGCGTWPIAAALAVFVLVSLPYLDHTDADGLIRKGQAIPFTTVSAAWAHIAPYNPLSSALPEPWRQRYATPLFVFLLSLFSLPLAFGWRGSSPANPTNEPRLQLPVLSRSLWFIALGAFVLTLGTQLQLGGWRITLPAQWAAYLVPGFADMRGPLRWGILISLVSPVLAGIGLHYIHGLAANITHKTTPTRVAPAITAVAAALVLASLPWPRVPTVLAMPEDQAQLGVYEELAALPAAPVLEVPWPDEAARDAVLASRYILASTLHWRPILNGYTGWSPPGYDFLRRLGRRLPHRDALENLRRLTGLEWIVVHADEMTAQELVPWDQALLKGTLLRVYADATARIYQVIVDAEPYSEASAVVTPHQPRQRTISGLSRERLELPAAAGRLEVNLPDRLNITLFGTDWLKTWLSATVTNSTDTPWPAVDPQGEGLVVLTYRFVDAAGRTILEGRTGLGADVPAHARLTTRVLIEGHIDPGDYVVDLSLVQQIGSEAIALPLESRKARVTVRAAAKS